MTSQEKLNLVTNYFSEDWAIEKAMQLLEDYDKAQQPAIKELRMSDTLTNAKLIIYILTSSIIKINPNYFSGGVYKAIASAEKELLLGLRELDEDISINDLMISLFQKERMH